MTVSLLHLLEMSKWILKQPFKENAPHSYILYQPAPSDISTTLTQYLSTPFKR